jgi:hypothetical protein
MSWTALTFATPEYEKYVEPWQMHIRALGGVPVVIPMRSTGDWAKNCGLKPDAILRGISKVRTPWFLYTDVDVQLLSIPKAPPTRRWDVGITPNLVKSHKNRVSAATIFFNQTIGAKKFLAEWQKRCRAQPGIDHSHLTRTIESQRRSAVSQVIEHAAAWEPNGLRNEPEAPAPFIFELIEPQAPVIAAMATFPPRLSGMLRVLNDLLPQVDKFYVYLNGYKTLPEGWPSSTKLVPIFAGPGTGNPDKGSQGKFHWVGQDDGYYLTVDDDIFYPENYVNYMIQGVEKYDRKCIVGLHGGIFQLNSSKQLPTHLQQDRLRQILGYDRGGDRDQAVHTLGAGAMASYPQAIGLTTAVIGGPLHSGDDEDLAIWAQRKKIGMIRLQGAAGWTRPNPEEWVKDPLHRRPQFKQAANAKIRTQLKWELYGAPK